VLICCLVLLGVIARGGQIVLRHAAAEAKTDSQRVAVIVPVNPAPAPTPRRTATPRGNIAVTVPRLVAIRLDSLGNPSEVMTNTGHPPMGDESLAVTRDGHAVDPSPALKTLMSHHTWTGNWSVPGQWHAWVESP
jgi:hypothetical protein